MGDPPVRAAIPDLGQRAHTPANCDPPTSTLEVSVLDPSGGSVSEAKITVENLDTNLQRSSNSGTNGAFTFTALPVGKYQVTVEKAGFSKFVQRGITLAVDQPVSIPVRLQIGNVLQQVTVAADAQLVNTESGTVGQLVSTKQIVDLPLNGRQPQALLFLAPGTVNETGNYCLVNCQGGVYPGEQDANVNGGGPSYHSNRAKHAADHRRKYEGVHPAVPGRNLESEW